MLGQYPKFKKGQVEDIYNKFPKEDKKFIENYLFYRKSRGLENTNDLRRYLIQIRNIIQVSFNKFDTLEDISKLAVLIDKSYLSNEVKKNLKINLSNLFQYTFQKDWKTRFMELDCFSIRKKKGQDSEQGKISDADIPTDKDVENMLKSENSTYWKTFLLIQDITGARTIEVRTLEPKKIEFNKDGTATIEIWMTKTGKKKYVFTDAQTTDYIKKLLDEKKNMGTLGKYLFSSPGNKDEPISKNAVNSWFHKLSLKATGRVIKPYWLRHKKATQLYNLALNNVISKDVVTRLLGHGKDMSDRYTHRPKEEEIAILKEQAFNTEISPEKKDEMKKQMEKQEEQIINLMGRIMDLEEEFGLVGKKGSMTHKL